jgi:hypothetical protein
MDTTVAILVGIGLAASCGFRVFVPLLVASGASLSGYLPLSDGFQWIGTWPALVAFIVASAFEVIAYYVPWLDNLLDTIASPLGVVSGVILFAASVTELDPLLHWSLAIIAGGGSAAVMQGGTVATRLASTATSGGFANFIFSTFELMAGFLLAVISIVAPILAVILMLVTCLCLYYIGRGVIRTFLGYAAKPVD